MSRPDAASTVIVMAEDELLIRMAASTALTDAGYTVHEAEDAQGALALLVAHPETRLLVTDVRMPGSIDGLELVYRVRERWPDVAVIVTSGHAHLEGGDLPRGAVYLSKPYAAATLVLMAASLVTPEPAPTKVGDAEPA